MSAHVLLNLSNKFKRRALLRLSIITISMSEHKCKIIFNMTLNWHFIYNFSVKKKIIPPLLKAMLLKDITVKLKGLYYRICICI